MGNVKSCFKQPEENISMEVVTSARAPCACKEPLLSPEKSKEIENYNAETKEEKKDEPLATERKKKPVNFQTVVDCGSDSKDHEYSEHVTVYGPITKKLKTNGLIQDGNPQEKEFAKTHRTAGGHFGYNIVVPAPGKFEVTLIFCETEKSSLGSGKRIFSVSVLGNNRMDIKDIDVFAKRGKYNPYVVKLPSVEADSQITITLRKGSAGNPFISGFIVRAVEWTKTENIPVRPGNTPKLAVTVPKEIYRQCTERISSYTANLSKMANGKMKMIPTYMFHKPGTKIRGLIVTFHDFSRSYQDFRIFNRFMYDQGYDIYNSVLAGHALASEKWPKSVLKESDRVKKTIADDQGLQEQLILSGKSPDSLGSFFDKLIELSPEFKEFGTPDNYLSATNQPKGSEYAGNFKNGHMNYALDGLEQLDMLGNHPGPVYLAGIGLGATIALALSCMRSGRVEKCISMAPLFDLHEFVPGSKLPYIKNLGPLDLPDQISPYPKSSYPVSALASARLFGKFVADSSKFKRLLRSGTVKMLFVLTEEEDNTSISAANDFYHESGAKKAGHQYFIYPRSAKVPHLMVDPTVNTRGMNNKFYQTLYQNCFTFLAEGFISTDNMRTNTLYTDTKPPVAKEGRRDFYEKAYRNTFTSHFSA